MAKKDVKTDIAAKGKKTAANKKKVHVADRAKAGPMGKKAGKDNKGSTKV